ncbi:MAG: hypothetical protein RIR51_1301 [Bacteroidota bacterium]|jgi:putative sigma-54 modulation protein
MKVHVHAIHFSADKKLVESIQKKLDKLDTFYDRIISGEVYLKIEQGLGKVKEKMLEIKLAVPGKTLFVRQKANTFEEALDVAQDSIVTRLKKYKEKGN